MLVLSLMSELYSKGLEVGAEIPSISTIDHTGTAIQLNEIAGSGTVVVFFYPKADTPGCTKQACSLRDGWDELLARHVSVIGVSTDSADAQQRFREKYELPFPLIADKEQTVADAFGKSRWSRQAYIFKDGRVIWRDLSASTAKQLDDVLAVLDGLEK
ncbi:MAG: peroxiredoxin [Coraliomargarita sp.]|nr:peroxiredoxin [Coraliomargarita sp.]